MERCGFGIASSAWAAKAPTAYGENEAYNPANDQWERYAPMLTPRHGMGAVVIGDAIYVAGGGPQMGGGVKSAINEEFRLA